MGLREPEAREGGDLPEQLLGDLLGHAGLAHATLEELPVELLHLAARAPRPHRPPEAVQFGRGEARDLDGDPHHLLLVEDHAHRIPEHGLQARMEVGHRFEALPAAQERVDGIALDRSRPDDRHLHDKVIELPGARLRKGLHLGPALDLEDPHGVGRLEHLEDLGHVLGQAVQVKADRAVVLDQLEGLVHRGEHPEAEQVELDELQRLDVALVELDDDAIDHRRPFDRGDVDEWRGGHEHPARMDRQVARKAIDPGTELEPALPVGKTHGRAAAWLGRRLGLDPGDRGVGGRGALVGAARCRRIPARRAAELVRGTAFGRPRRGFGHAALRVERPTPDECRWQQAVPIGLVTRPPARPQPGDAGRRISPGRPPRRAGPARPDRWRRLGKRPPTCRIVKCFRFPPRPCCGVPARYQPHSVVSVRIRPIDGRRSRSC